MFSKALPAILALVVFGLNVCADDTVVDCVNAISGEYVESSTDLHSDSLEIQRRYVPQQGNWHFCPEGHLILSQESIRHAREVLRHVDMCEIILDDGSRRLYVKTERQIFPLAVNNDVE